MWIQTLTHQKFWLFCSLILILPGWLDADSPLLSGVLETHFKQGFEALYSMEYSPAKKEFEEMTRLEPKHPSGYIYLASAIWLEHLSRLRRLQSQIYNRNNAFFQSAQDPVDPTVEKLFYQNIEKGIVRAKALLRVNQNDLAGLYYLGTAHGAIAGYESSVKRAFLSSLKNGTKAVEMHKQLLKIYPAFSDVYVSVGMYNYVIGTLPIGIKFLMLLGGVHGSREEGLKQLEKAMNQGRYARDEASVILVMLYDREKRQEEALKILRKLSEKYPRNMVFRFETATMLTKTGHFTESMAIYDGLMKNESARNYMLDLIHFEYGEILFSMQSWQKAYEHYLMARRVMDNTPEGLISMTHLRAGLCLNAMRRDQEASVEYRFVLNQRDVNDSHRLAKLYSKKPFHP
jgi:tetratricopeptide (TPR) repeat protein